tara:strand:- start:34 stop:195 length:162 start_codon:yes stop_codon:yes gene_type:complete
LFTNGRKRWLKEEKKLKRKLKRRKLKEEEKEDSFLFNKTPFLIFKEGVFLFCR